MATITFEVNTKQHINKYVNIVKCWLQKLFVIINYYYNGYVYFKEPFKQFNWKAGVKPPSDETQKPQQIVYKIKIKTVFVYFHSKQIWCDMNSIYP